VLLLLLLLLQVLLKSSNADIRGFTAKVSDFGLSRVEDDDTCATFPFNSCGTAAYVAPEALITTKKVREGASSTGWDVTGGQLG
jgi:serine/threonine protein kinase